MRERLPFMFWVLKGKPLCSQATYVSIHMHVWCYCKCGVHRTGKILWENLETKYEEYMVCIQSVQQEILSCTRNILRKKKEWGRESSRKNERRRRRGKGVFGGEKKRKGISRTWVTPLEPSKLGYTHKTPKQSCWRTRVFFWLPFQLNSTQKMPPLLSCFLFLFFLVKSIHTDKIQ